MPPILPWIISAIAVAGLLLAAPFAVFIPLGLLLGGLSAGTALLVVGLTLGFESAGEYGTTLYVAAGASSILAVGVGIRSAVRLFRAGVLPSLFGAVADAFKYLLTLHLALQISLGAILAVAAVLLTEGAPKMTTSEAIVVSLFSVFVFLVSATFTSYFMRSLIPWRNEQPSFSDAVAYTLSILLGLIAATYAFAGAHTFTDASKIGALLYQASVAIGTLGATIVGGYVAVMEKRRQISSQTPV
jgi:hypothetical protein